MDCHNIMMFISNHWLLLYIPTLGENTLSSWLEIHVKEDRAITAKMDFCAKINIHE